VGVRSLEGAQRPRKRKGKKNLCCTLPIPSSFNFHFPLFSLKSTSNNLRLLSCKTCHLLPSLHLSFNNVFYKADPTQDVTNLLSLLLPYVGKSICQSITTILHYDKFHMATCFDFQEVIFRPFEVVAF
jgi:hypothetical protein